MKKVIIDFKKLTPRILKLLVDKYPDGYDIEDMLSFPTPNPKKFLKVIEIKTEDAVYLVKASEKLELVMEGYRAELYEKFDQDDTEAIKEPNTDL